VKLARIETAGGPRVAAVEGDHFVPFDRDLSRDDMAGFTAGQPSGSPVAAADARFLAPVPDPGKIIAVGLNYVDHAAETAIQAPAAPLLFSKTINTLLPHNGTITANPAITSQVDFEGELTVVIGKAATGVSVDTALEHVFGYTIGNDVSARDVQFADGQWLRGKSLDTFCPLGPYVVTADEVPDPQDLRIVTTVNGTVMQNESTSAMIFGVAEIVSYVSRSISLVPGDIILTGTPAGVGMGRKPPVFLADGDIVTVTIDPIGTLTNPVHIG
jgi:2-keto-4-pentenoate hydratase/2-oxohepta-3-ene-1,7-dioic acid hydratase in catechol pathway